MALIRGHHDFDDHFAQIPNDWLRDRRVSLEARGLLAQIMSHRPGWNLSINSIAHQNNVGRDKVRRILDELIGAGYLERSESQSHNDKGHLAGYDYITCDPSALAQEPHKAEPHKVEPTKANEPPKKTIPKEHYLEQEDYKERKELVVQAEIVSPSSDVFDEWWDAYPLKKGKGAARVAYAKARKKVPADKLQGAVEVFRDDPNRGDTYLPHPTTWLNEERWDDEPYQEPGQKARKMTNAEQGALLAAQYRAEEQGQLESAGARNFELESEWGSMVRGVDDE